MQCRFRYDATLIDDQLAHHTACTSWQRVAPTKLRLELRLPATSRPSYTYATVVGRVT